MRATLVGLATSALLFLPSRGAAQSIVPWSALDMCFAVSPGSTTIVHSVVGQGFVGMMRGGNTMVETGFLADTLFRRVTTSLVERGAVPREFVLHQNYPNPFNPSTTIRLELPRQTKVNLTVYNLFGQNIVTPVDEEKQAGVYHVKFVAGGRASGMYVYRLNAGDFVAAKRLVLVK